MMETEPVCETVDLNHMKQLTDHEVLLNFRATKVQEIRLLIIIIIIIIIIIMFVLWFLLP